MRSDHSGLAIMPTPNWRLFSDAIPGFTEGITEGSQRGLWVFGSVALLVVFGVTLLTMGLTASVASGILETQAAGRQRIPLWGSDGGYRRPRADVIVQLTACVLVAAGAVLLLIAWGSAAVFFMSFVFVPSLVVRALHNRHVRTSQLARVATKARSSTSISDVEPNI